VVAGASEAGTLQAMQNAKLMGWLQAAQGRVERIASVCTGSFVLAGAGLLEGKRATTHWIGCDRFAKMFPRVSVDRDAIFVRDGAIWTSAGVLTGIDMALAIVEADLGSAVADAVAAHLVLYARRPGSQSQFSQAMVAQLANSNPLGTVLAWVRAHLDLADVEVFAKRAGVSVRTLHRRCLIEFGCTPAKLLNKLRVEHACSLLATSSLSAKALTAQCGFGSCEHLRRVFQQVMDMSPENYRMLHARSATRNSSAREPVQS
jgi:transcriptional regulator GlxA family with amidase domain